MTRREWDVRQSFQFGEADRFQRVIVNAAVKDTENTLYSKPDTVLDTINVNAVGALRTVQSVLPHLDPESRIAIISSEMGSSVLTGGVTLYGRYGEHHIDPTYSLGYRMSKAALHKLVQCLAVDLKAKRIFVYAIDPGWVKTEMGGQFATLEPQRSAEEVVRTLENLPEDFSGLFFDWKGNKLEW